MTSTIVKVPCPKARVSTQRLTYGVELECVFAFHEKELGLDKYGHGAPIIVKDLSYFQREDPRFTTISLLDNPYRVYNSWGLNKGNVDGPGARTYPYETEPMEIAGRALSKRYPNLKFRVEATPRETAKTKDRYGEWLVTADHTVCGVGSRNISIPLARAGRDNPESWDSYGIELVSRVLKSDSAEDKVEVAKVVKAIRGDDNDRYGAFITSQCGMHVHVQAPEELEVLKKLALIIIVYEQEISRLHPACRRTTNSMARGSHESNRMGAMEIYTNSVVGRKLFDPTTEALSQKFDDSVENIRWQISDIGGKYELARYVNAPESHTNPNGNRNRQVNFVSTVRGDEFPSTIEFRQARGSLDPEDISRWIDFCIGLVRLASLYHEHPGRFPAKTIRGTDVLDLMRDMELGDEAIVYWRARMAKYSLGDDEEDWFANESPPSEPDSSSSSHHGYSPPPPGSLEQRDRQGGSGSSNQNGRDTRMGGTDSQDDSVDYGSKLLTDLANQGMYYDRFGWRMTDFNVEDWITSYVDSQIGGREGFCGIRALHESMRRQYPLSEFSITSASAILEIFNAVCDRDRPPTAEDLQLVLDHWTARQIKLVVCSGEAWGWIARRPAGGGPGRNLYIHYVAAPGVAGAHWQSMGRSRAFRGSSFHSAESIW